MLSEISLDDVYTYTILAAIAVYMYVTVMVLAGSMRKATFGAVCCTTSVVLAGAGIMAEQLSGIFWVVAAIYFVAFIPALADRDRQEKWSRDTFPFK